MMISMINTIIS